MDIGSQNTSRPHEDDSRTEGLAAAAEDAELLLRYAAQSGIDVPTDAIATLVRVRAGAASGPFPIDAAAAFYAAYARLAARLQPVTIDTLRVPEACTRRVLRRNGVVSTLLALAVMACSIVTFQTTSMTTEIGNGIQHANELAVRLHEQVGPAKVAIGVADICLQPLTAPDPPLTAKDVPLLTREL